MAADAGRDPGMAADVADEMAAEARRMNDENDKRRPESILCCPHCGVNCVVDPPGVRCPMCGKRPADILNPEGKGIGERR